MAHRQRPCFHQHVRQSGPQRCQANADVDSPDWRGGRVDRGLPVRQTTQDMNSIDASTRALFEQLPPWPLREPHTARLDGATVVIVPGAFYQTHKDTGADGGVIREEAEHLGARTDIIPLPNLASLRSNARQICAWLNRRTDQRAILVSLSKGSADVKAALAEDPQAFTRVVAWVNVS